MKKFLIILTLLFSTTSSFASNTSEQCKDAAAFAGIAMDYRQSNRSIVDTIEIVEEGNKKALLEYDSDTFEYKFTEAINEYLLRSLKSAYLKPYYNLDELDLKIKNDFINEAYFKCLKN